MSGQRKGRVVLRRAQGHWYWELRVSEAQSPGRIVAVWMTPYQLSDLLAGAWTTADIEAPDPTPTKEPS